MKVSIVWLGVVLISTFLLYFTVYGRNVYESFTTFKNIEGFQSSVGSQGSLGLQITTCPADSKSYIDDVGMTVCCKGVVESDKCSGQTICSLSEGTNSAPKCTDWYAAYLRERGRGRCPSSMPNYYESMNGQVRGCTSGLLSANGDGPLSYSDKTCKIYPTKREDRGYTDSCSNIKFLESSSCFTNSMTVDKQLLPTLNGFLPPLVSCKYGDINTLTAGICNTDSSVERMMRGLFDLIYEFTGIKISVDDWKSGSSEWDPVEKLNFCSVTQKYKIDRIITYSDLPKISVF